MGYIFIIAFLIIILLTCIYMDRKLYNELLKMDESHDDLVAELNRYNNEIYNEEEKQRFTELAMKIVNILNEAYE